jgi:hypothetical protein
MSEAPAQPIEAEFFRPVDRDEWDHFVAGSANGSLLHTRRFLDYHGARFRDVSLLFRDARNGELIGVMPIVAAMDGAPTAISHAGSSFGGLITKRPDPLVTAVMFAWGSRRLQDAGFETLAVVTHPTVFHRQPDDSDQLFLTLAGKVAELHLWSVIQLHNRTLVARKCRAYAKSAQRSGLTVHQTESPDDYRRFYDMLARDLGERHQREPLHNFDEVIELRKRFGASARLCVALSAGSEMLAATWIWDYENGIWHSQYICSTPEGRRRRAVDVLLLHCSELARASGQRVYSLGRNTLSDGWHVNDGLLKFKKRLGCGLAAQRRIEVALADLSRVSDDWILKYQIDQRSAD